MKKSKLKSIIKEYIIEANKDTMQYDLMNRELKSALKVKDFEKAAFYKELLMSSNLQASVGWDRFKGSWAYESWIKKPNTQSPRDKTNPHNKIPQQTKTRQQQNMTKQTHYIKQNANTNTKIQQQRQNKNKHFK